MKSVLLIGLGRFGRHMAKKFQAMNHEVMAIDRDAQRVNDALPFVTNAQIGDATLICVLWPLVTTSKVLWKPPLC